MAYKIIFANAAKRQFDKLPKPAQKRLSNLIDQLGNNPRPSGVVKLTGENQLYRVRDGDYRIIYQIEDDQLLVLIVKAEHRKDIYKN